MSETEKRKSCPECGSLDTSSDVEMEDDKQGEAQIIEEYDFCWRCGYKFNMIEKKDSAK